MVQWNSLLGDQFYSSHEQRSENIKDAKLIFRSGADKILFNTGLINNKKLVKEIANIYGEQSIIASIDVKKDILEHLWRVIISDNTIDHYESNLMRRVCGLIYVPDKICAEVKLKLLNS